MFTKNTYLIPQVSTLDHCGLDEILLHHHADMFYGQFLDASADPVHEADAMFNQDVVGLTGDLDSMENNTSQVHPTAKKDRHSKIFTAQGPRDRRVRLSKGTARKFFDLQEILGFDKPSKTLDWLLTKSRTSIKELLQTKQKGSSSSQSECEVLSSAGNGEYFDQNGNYIAADSRQKAVEGAKDLEQQTGVSLAKESRAKARERARARTREKMCIKQLNEAREIQHRNNQFEVFESSAGSGGNNASCFKKNAGIGESGVYHPVVNGTSNEGRIQESVAIRRSSHHQQSLAVSRDFMTSSNYSTVPSFNVTEDWDYFCNFTSQSDVYTVWDQHKFINSTTSNM